MYAIFDTVHQLHRVAIGAMHQLLKILKQIIV